jgi:L-amino acid N-acyltransferase YncA
MDEERAPRAPAGPRAAAPIGLRAVVPRDARALAALMAGIYAEGRWFVGDGPPSPDALARQLRALDPTREVLLVAEGPGGLAGWVEARRYAPRSMEHVATLTLAVAAPARRRGVGRRLLRALTPWARRVGVRKLRLDVRAGNEGARALYASEGYRVEGVERDQIRDEDGFEDNVIMALDLTDGAGPSGR